MSLNDALRDKIRGLIAADAVVLFMKGTRLRPACGFSAGVVEVLDSLVPRWTSVDVLADAEVREGIKEFSAWPTIPQLYVRGEFVGGADIVREMHASGELATLLGAPEVRAPQVHVSPRAAAVFREVTAEAGPGEVIRVRISPRFEHDLAVEGREQGDLEVVAEGVTMVFDRMSAARADGLRIDFIDRDGEAGFAIDNPNAPPQVKPITASELQGKLAQGAVRLFDVRTPQEQAIAAIAGARLLDEAVRAEILELDRGTPLAFHCHHGMRSQAAAEFFVSQGFREVYNLRGGIDAWSREVDSGVPRY
ncbi:Grx4 family monothiol glutaredoxin [Nannocystis sp. SCPEA4]|uniref:Grx4 family monothiol glutaredoxin n=1 Tax=Nannocystis sp. SCPEA4 TaxID=2996787 RepID=UPI00226E5A28|nr:Grx4 family monothiol glutaredoxin [Nannocystis sp. SCPEA4]MCY1063062.1 Grx4 family monothiol glutaredoxin [Nannocystis sp. SCPEA4]